MEALNLVLGFLVTVPVVGPVLVKVLGFTLAASAVATALFAVWQAVVKTLKAIGLIPGLGAVDAMAEKLKVSEEGASGFWTTKVLPVLDYIAHLPMPKK